MDKKYNLFAVYKSLIRAKETNDLNEGWKKDISYNQ